MNKQILGVALTLTAATAAVGYFVTSTNAERNDGNGDASDVGVAPSPFSVVAAGEEEGACEPNVQVSRLGLNGSGNGDDWAYYGAADVMINGVPTPVRAFSAASTSCNVGCATAEWISGSSGRHPVIAQNIYRLLDGRFEHVALSWLKHSFCAVSENTCGACAGTPCSTLGVGCADTYWATLNGSVGGLGPRLEINPWPTEAGTTPTHTDPHQTPSAPGEVDGKALIKESVVEEGGQYFFEIHYITHDEPYFNRYDNASWRYIDMSMTNISTAGIPDGQGQDSVKREPAIFAYREVADATISQTNPPNDGTIYLGHLVTDNGDGTWRYDYSLYNMNSARAVRSVSIPLGNDDFFPPYDPAVQDTYFHAPFYHSGNPESMNDPWNTTVDNAGGHVLFDTQTHDQNPNASALRWGTINTYSLTTNSPPINGDLTLGLFHPPLGETVTIAAMVPGNATTQAPCDADTNGDNVVNVTDLVNTVLDWGSDGSVNGGDANGDGIVDVLDILATILAWGPCP